MGCCDDNVELSTPGQDGNNGLTYYPHIAYADNVVAGAPDVVTNFSNTPLSTSYWAAIIFTLSDTVPLEAAYENAWFEYRGADGAAITGIDIEENNVGVTTNSTILNFFGSGASGVTVTDAGSGQANIEIITAALIKTTRTDILIDISANTLIPGVTYWVTDVGDGADDPSQESGIILRAIATNKLGIDGIYVAKVVDRAVVTTLYDSHTNYVYDGITDFYVEAFNEVYRLDTVAAAADYPTHPSDDGANWTFMSKDTALLYKLELHSCKYDIENDIIRSREDSRGNKLTNVGLIGSTGNQFIQQCFRWGVETTINNNIVCYQDVGGWSSGRFPNFSSWYQDYSSVALFYGNTIDAGVVFKNTDFEAIAEVYGCTFKCPMIGAATNINFYTGTLGVSAVISLINTEFINTVITECHTSTITKSKFLECNLGSIIGTTFTEDDFTRCIHFNIENCIFFENNMNDSVLGVSDSILPGKLLDTTISNNKGKCDMRHLTNCDILANDFAEQSHNGFSYIRDCYDFKYVGNNSSEFLEIGNTDEVVYTGLVAPNDVFNTYSIGNCIVAQCTFNSHFEMSKVRSDLNTNPGVRDGNNFIGFDCHGTFSNRLTNLIFVDPFSFQYLTFGALGGLHNFNISPSTASYTGTFGGALPAGFGGATTAWAGWQIDIPLYGGELDTKPYNYFSGGTSTGSNYFVEENATANPINKLISITESNAVGFLDMEDSTIFSGTTLTIPLGMQWIGKYYLYNVDSAYVIHNIVNLVDSDSSTQIIKEFRVLPTGVNDDLAAFRSTAIASATATTLSYTSAATTTIKEISDFIKIKTMGLPSDSSSFTLEIIETSIKA